MEVSKAVEFIQGAVAPTGPETWADLGAGKGLFTLALAKLLPAGSKIFAVDKSAEVQQIRLESADISLTVLQEDFTKSLRELPVCDGIVMANALHYVKDQFVFLSSLKQRLTSKGRLVVIEYDMQKSNPWVPYPIPFERLRNLAASAGFAGSRPLIRAQSTLNTSEIYSAALAVRP